MPSKNSRHLLGKPLIAYSIEQARESDLFEAIVVSTDSDQIAEISEKYGARAWFRRPSEMATNQAPKLPAIRHAFLESEKFFRTQFDALIDLDATSPLREIGDIEQAYKKFVADDAANLITACRARKNPYFNMVEITNGAVNLVKTHSHKGVKRLLIDPTTTVTDALQQLSRGGEKCLVVVDRDDALLGTLSDGDLRKALVKGKNTEESISEIFNSDACFLEQGSFSVEQAKALFLENKFDLIPIVSTERKVINYLVWEEVFADHRVDEKTMNGIAVTTPYRRQDAPSVFEMNASIYIWRRQALLENESLFTDKTALYLMPEERSFDIDSELDWEIVEMLLKKKLISSKN